MHDLVTLTVAEKRIAAIVRPLVEELGYVLVRLRIGGGRNRHLQIMAERADGGMEIDDCAKVSKAVSAVLDVEDPISDAYTLEVSSPGIDRPLTRLTDFSEWRGHLARVELTEPVDGRRRFKGKIVGVSGDDVQIDANGATAALDFALISNARLVLTDVLLKSADKRKPSPRGEAEGK